jgi:predicted transcriptional regulator
MMVYRKPSESAQARKMAKRAAARRECLPGFPKPAYAMTKAEVDEYFSHEKIQCLLCGKWYGRLAGHLTSIHSITESDYRDMWELPYTYGLTGRVSHAAYSKAIKQRMADGFDPNEGVTKVEIAERMKSADRRKSRKFFKEAAVKKSMDLAGIDRSWSREDIWPTLQYSLDNLVSVPEAVRALGGKPSRSAIQRAFSADPELKAEFRRKIDELPYDHQTKIKYGLSEAFWVDVRRYRSEGLSDKSISDITGVWFGMINKGRRERGIK